MKTDHTSEGTIHSAESYTAATYAAVEMFNQGDFRGAISRLREMARVNPENIKVHEVLADAYLKVGKIDLAEQEILRIREIASRVYPGLANRPTRTFEELVANAHEANELESRYQRLLGSDSVHELLRNSGVASQLSLKLMAAGEYENAEKVVTEYRERLASVCE